VIANVRRLLAPDGLLVMPELCREYHQFTISRKFLVSSQHGQSVADSTDVRVEGDRSLLLTRSGWPSCGAPGWARCSICPTPMMGRRAALAQHLFVATPMTFKSEQLVATCAGTLRENFNHAGMPDAVHGEIQTRGGKMPRSRSVESGRSVR
jgi:hypothetical protein